MAAVASGDDEAGMPHEQMQKTKEGMKELKKKMETAERTKLTREN